VQSRSVQTLSSCLSREAATHMVGWRPSEPAQLSILPLLCPSLTVHGASTSLAERPGSGSSGCTDVSLNCTFSNMTSAVGAEQQHNQQPAASRCGSTALQAQQGQRLGSCISNTSHARHTAGRTRHLHSVSYAACYQQQHALKLVTHSN
jgi:hypothetical protein